MKADDTSRAASAATTPLAVVPWLRETGSGQTSTQSTTRDSSEVSFDQRVKSVKETLLSSRSKSNRLLDNKVEPKVSEKLSLHVGTKETDGLSASKNHHSSMRELVEKAATPLDHVFHFLPGHPVFSKVKQCCEHSLAVVEPERSGLLNDLVTHPHFEMGCLSVIMFNAFFSAFVADYEIKNLNMDKEFWMLSLEVFFVIFYTFELGVKLAVHGCFFFWNSEWGWNNFDFLLVLLSVYEQVMTYVLHGIGGNVSFMRILRLLKLSKVARLFRVLRFFRELRLMLYAIKASFVSLFWALIMLIFIFYVISLVILQGITNLLEQTDIGEMVDEDTRDAVLEVFHSLVGTLVALYKSSTGGEDWGVYYNLVCEAGWVYGMLFLLYIAFFTFSVMNILTGIIVENVVSMAGRDQETVLLEYRTRCNGEIKEMKSLFNCLDVNHDGFITLQEWQAGMETEKVNALMAAMELDINDASVFFDQLLAIAEEGEVDIGTFVDGCMKMRGTASSIDMQLLAFQGRVIQQSLAELNRQLMSSGVVVARNTKNGSRKDGE